MEATEGHLKFANWSSCDATITLSWLAPRSFLEPFGNRRDDSTGAVLIATHEPRPTPTKWDAGMSAFKSLPRGWDGYDAPAPSGLAIETASRLAQAFDESFLSPSRIAPSVVGGVGLTFRNTQGRKVYIEIYNDARVYAMFSDPDESPEIVPTRVTSEQERRSLVDQTRVYLG